MFWTFALNLYSGDESPPTHAFGLHTIDPAELPPDCN
jgi:hypothetical protein